MKIIVSIFLSLLMAISACAEKASVSRNVDDALLSNEESGENWATYGRTYSMQHYSPLEQINRDNIDKLGLAWSRDLNVKQRADSQPLEHNGIVYTATGFSIVQAFNAKTGELLWRYDPKVPTTIKMPKLWTSWGIRGFALWEDMVIVGTQDGRLIALKQKNGEEVWSTMTLDPDDETNITGPPRVYDGKVVIGFAGAERADVRGSVSAWDARTGEFLWRFYTIPGNPADGFESEAMEMAAKTWTGEWWKYGGGGTVWHGITYDPEFDRLYLGTGNAGPWNWQIRNPGGGDNLFLSSIVALDADTGEYVWHYQEVPNDAWDYAATMDIVLATLEIGGKPSKVILHAPKAGFLYVVDRETGKLISAEKIGKVTWAEKVDPETGRPVVVEEKLYKDGPVLVWPGPYGVHNWPPMSYNRKTGLVYIPAIHAADVFSSKGIDVSSWEETPGHWNMGMGDRSGVDIPYEEFGSSLLAWDPVRQEAVWESPNPGTWNGGTMSTAGNLVFQGHIDGTLNAFDAKTGKKLWSFNAGVSVLGSPITYKWLGTQYVTVLAGPPSGSAAATLRDTHTFGWRYRDHPRRILTFALNGSAELPPSPPPKPAEPLKVPGFKVDQEKAEAGKVVFDKRCGTCHGYGVIAGGAAPELRASAIPLSEELFEKVVRGDMLLEFGMPVYPGLSDEDLKALRHYIRREANRDEIDPSTQAPNH